MMRLREFDDWPPQPMGSFSRVLDVPSPDQAVLTKVVGINGKTVELEAQSKYETYNFDFEAPTPEITEKVAAVLRNNIGKTMLGLGVLAVEVY